MKKVLFVLGNFFPEPSANAICCMEIMKMMVSNGCEVHCVANQWGAMTRGEIIEGVHVHRVRVPLNYNLNKQYAKKRSRVFLRILLKILNGWYSLLSAMHFPFMTLRFSRAMLKKTSSVVDEHGIETVVCVNQLTTSLYVGCKLKKRKPTMQLVAYLLDPIRNGYSHKLVSKRRAEAVLLSLQNKVLRCFDLVIAQNEHNKLFEYVTDATVRDKLFFLGAPLLTKRSMEAVALDTGKKTVIYAGGLASTRSPAYIAEVFRYVSTATLHIFTSNQGPWLDEMVKDNPNIVLHPSIGRDELLPLMKGADALLNIGNTQSEYAPSKIIECISFGKPLISTYRTDDDACRKYMEKYPQGLYMDERTVPPEKAAVEIDVLLSASEKEVAFSMLEGIYWYNTPNAFIHVITQSKK